QKTTLLIKKYKITASELEIKLVTNTRPWFIERGPTLGWLDLNALPTVTTDSGQPLFDSWTRLLDFFTFRNSTLPGKPTLFEILEGAITFTGGGNPVALQQAVDTYIAQLSIRVGRPSEDLQALIGVNGALALTFPDDYKDERVLVRLAACLAITRR